MIQRWSRLLRICTSRAARTMSTSSRNPGTSLCDMAHSWVWHDSFICAWVWHDSFICAAYCIVLIATNCNICNSLQHTMSTSSRYPSTSLCDMLSFMSVTWLVRMCQTRTWLFISVTRCSIYNKLQHTATHCNTLQHTATHYHTHGNTRKHTATHCKTQTWLPTSTTQCNICNTLQHTATHCNTLQHTAAHCNTLQHTHLEQLTELNACKGILQRTATHCNTLQHPATRCNTHTWAVHRIECTPARQESHALEIQKGLCQSRPLSVYEYVCVYMWV